MDSPLTYKRESTVSESSKETGYLDCFFFASDYWKVMGENQIAWVILRLITEVKGIIFSGESS